MNKTELIAAVAEKAELSKKDAEAAITAAVDAITEALTQGEKAHPGGPGLYLKGAKAHQLDLVVVLQGLGDGSQSSGDDSLGVLLGHAGLFRHGGDQFGLIHDSPPKNFPWSKSIPKR